MSQPVEKFEPLLAEVLTQYRPLILATAKDYGSALARTDSRVDHLAEAEQLARITTWSLWLDHLGDPGRIVKTFPQAYRLDVIDELRDRTDQRVHQATRARVQRRLATNVTLSPADRLALVALDGTISLDALAEEGCTPSFAGAVVEDFADSVVERLTIVAEVRGAVDTLDVLPREVVEIAYLGSDRTVPDGEVAEELADRGWGRWTRQRVQQIRSRALRDLRPLLAHLCPGSSTVEDRVA